MLEIATKNKQTKIAALLIVILAVMVLLLAAIFIGNYVDNKDKTVEVHSADVSTKIAAAFEAGSSYDSIVTKNKLILYSPDSIKFINIKGETENEFPCPVSNPIVSANEQNFLISEKNGQNAYLYSGYKTQHRFTLDEPIIIANVSQQGNCVFVTKGELHKNSVRVLKPDGEEIFKWNSGDLNVIDAGISKSGKDITISAVDTKGETVNAHILMFDTAKDKPYTSDPYEDILFPVVSYSGNEMFCIGDTKTVIYSGYGNKMGEIDYANRDLISYTLSDNEIALAFSGNEEGINAKGSVVESYNSKGKLLGKFEVENEIEFLDSIGGRIAVNNGRAISVLSKRCYEVFRLKTDFEIREFKFFGTANRAIGITGGGAEVFNVN